MVAYVDVLTLCPAHNTYAKHRFCVHAQNMEDVSFVFWGAAIQGQLGYASHVDLCLHFMEVENFVFLRCCHSGAAWVCSGVCVGVLLLLLPPS